MKRLSSGVCRLEIGSQQRRASPLAGRTLAAAAAACLALGTLSGCVPLLVGGAAVSTGLIVTDRRTSGMQLEDQTIELKVGARGRELLGNQAQINGHSYNRTVLLTGEVPTEADRQRVEQAVARIENVLATVNELEVAAPSSIGSRSNDELLTKKVQLSLIDARDLQANAFKVVTERGVVYLMGRVTEREASRASEVARGIPGVLKVVRVLDVVSEDELAGKR